MGKHSKGKPKLMVPKNMRKKKEKEKEKEKEKREEAEEEEEESREGPEAQDGSEVFEEGAVGSKFYQGVNSLMGKDGFDPKTYFDENIYGNLLTVSKRYVDRKKAKLEPAFDSLCRSIFNLLKNCVPREDQGMESYIKTRSDSSIIGKWQETVKSHPHSWPQSDLFEYILDLRDILYAVDESTNNSLSANDQSLFEKWKDTEKILLPCDIPHKFIGIPLNELFPNLVAMYTSANAITHEFSTPPYGWQISISNNLRKQRNTTGMRVEGFEGAIKSYFSKEIFKYYLEKLGVMDHRVNCAQLISGLAVEGTPEIAKSVMKSMTRGQGREMAVKAFGREAVDDIEATNDAMERTISEFDHEKKDEDDD